MTRLSMSLCPACFQANDDDATHCAGCGTPLVMRCPGCDAINVRSRISCHRCRAALWPGPASGWSETLAGDATSEGPDTEPAVVLTLLEDALDGRPPAYWGNLPAAGLAAAPGRAWPATPHPPPLSWPRLDGDEPLPAARAEAAGAGPVVDPSGATAAAHDDADAAALTRRRAKAERRARVRQRQLHAQRDAMGRAIGAPDEVLLLEPDAESRRIVCAELEGFGFRPHVVASAREALAGSAQRRYAVALLGLGRAADLDAAELCHRLRRLPPFGATPVFAIGDAGGHAERVRMQLAGAHATLLRPVGRGALAHSLQAHGVVLPRDPRVGAPPPLASQEPGR